MLPDIAHAPRILPPYTEHIQQNLKKVCRCCGCVHVVVVVVDDVYCSTVGSG